MQHNGGLIAAEDFARFHARVGEPVKAEYHGYEVYKAGFWTQGPAMVETLNLLDGYDLKTMGHNSADYIHTLDRIAQTRARRSRSLLRRSGLREDSHHGTAVERLRALAAFADRKGTRFFGAAARRSAKHESCAGEFAADNGHASNVPAIERANDTTCVNVIDKDGNLFSATPSGAWLPAVVAGDTGVLMGQRLQSALTDPKSPNVVAPGKRPRITLTPTLVLKDGEPFMVLSTPGGDNQDQALLQVLLNIIEFGMNPQEAVEAARFDTQHYVSSFDDHEFLPGSLNIESRVDEKTIAELKARGHKVNVQSAWGTLSSPTVIIYNTQTGVASAGADPRRGRYAVAW